MKELIYIPSDLPALAIHAENVDRLLVNKSLEIFFFSKINSKDMRMDWIFLQAGIFIFVLFSIKILIISFEFFDFVSDNNFFQKNIMSITCF
jgi:hypothetical protein